MDIALSRRLARAFEAATLEEREALVAAAQGVTGFDGLSAWARSLVVELEARLSAGS